MDFLIGLFVVGLPLFLVFFALAKYRKDWVGIWRGRKIHIVRTLGQCLLYIDNQEICKKSLWKRHINHQWNDPIHGPVDILLSMQTDSSGGIGSYQLLIDGEIVHLAQAPTDWAGNTIKTEIPTLKDTTVVEGTQITDPRYAAAERLLKTISTELGEDKESLSLIQGLHNELKEHILIAERLLQSKADYASLGNDGGDMEAAQQQTEERIQLLLTALQDIHLAIVQRNISSSTPVLEQVHSLLAQIDAEVEVENSSAHLLQKKMQQKIQRL